MILNVAPPPRFKAFYPGTGTPLSGGRLYSAQPGTNVQFGVSPAYPQPTYSDPAGLVQNLNPIILDANGEADVWLSDFTKLVLYDEDGVLVWSVDEVSAQPLIQQTELQWVPQSSQITYISTTQFSVPGNQTTLFPVGTAVKAAISGGDIYGIVTASSASGTPITTTVTVSWFSTAMNATVSAIYTGIVGPQGSGSGLPVSQPVTKTADYVVTIADMFKTMIINPAAVMTVTLPSAAAVPPGTWIDLHIIKTTIDVKTVQIIGTVNGVVDQFMLGTKWHIWSDGTNWWASVEQGLSVPITMAAALSGGTAQTSTAIALGAIVPAHASAVWGYITTNASAMAYLTPIDSANGRVQAGVSTTVPFYLKLNTPQTLYYTNSAGSGSTTVAIGGYIL